MDLCAAPSLGRSVDEVNRDLIVRLCTEAGMRMEDASVIAPTIGGHGDLEVHQMLDRLVATADQIASLLTAAKALCE